MESNHTIRYVCYAFSESDLFKDQEVSKHFDLPACIRNYTAACEGALREMYPSAEQIEVINTDSEGIHSTQVIARYESANQAKRVIQGEDDQKTRRVDIKRANWNSLEAWMDLDYYSEEEEFELTKEVEVIENRCDRIYQESKWEVHRPWLNVLEAYEKFSVPIGIISWACQKGLVDEAEQIDGIWEFPRECLIESGLTEEYERNECNALTIITGEPPSHRFECHSRESCSHININLTEFNLISVPPDWIMVSILQTENSSVSIKTPEDLLQITIDRFRDDKTWNQIWTFKAYGRAIEKAVDSHNHPGMKLGIESKFGCITIRILLDQDRSHNLESLLTKVRKTLQQVKLATELALAGGPTWQQRYERDERAFCEEVIGPLLMKMGFDDVRYVHGRDEYGRDFIFSEVSRFDENRHIGLQAKKGSLSGTANSEIDDLFSQIRRALEMEYEEPGDPPIYLSEIIVAISGSFTNNAKKIIRRKLMSLASVGSVYFWDKATIRSLIRKFWIDEQDSTSN